MLPRSLVHAALGSRAALGRAVARALSATTGAATAAFALPTAPARYNGVTVDMSSLPAQPSVDAFGAALARMVHEARAAGKSSIWLTLAMNQGALFAPAAACGFTFHHAEGSLATLHAWLPGAPCPVPPFATHQVGVAGVALDAAGRLLVVKDVGKASAWKFPGGLANLGEDFGETAVRETFEETGVRTAFRSVLAMRHQHGVGWGRSDLYVLCRLAPLSSEITLDPREIAEAQWMDAHEFLAGTSHPLNRWVAEAVLHEARREADAAASAAAIEEESVFIPVTKRHVKCYRAGAAWPIVPAGNR